MVEAVTERTVGSKLNETSTHEDGRFTGAYPQGGIVLEDEGQSMTKVGKNILYQIGKTLLKGKFTDVLKITMPAYVHCPKTYLSQIQKDAGYYEFFIREAMARPDDHEWKLKNILLAQISALTSVTEQGARSPLNPILGETLTCESKRGTKIYMEQTSHHPPISHFLIEGPEDCPFKMNGHLEYTVKAGYTFTYADCTFPGVISLELPDGTHYQLEQPKCQIDGVLTSTKVLNVLEEMELKDMTNLMTARVKFDVNAANRNTGMMRFVKGSDKKDKNGVYQNRMDLISIEVIKLSEDADSEVVDRGFGSWLEKIHFANDDEPMWTINSEVNKSEWLDDPSIMVLESDSYKRLDLIAIRDKEWETAEAEKIKLEERQRADKKLRDEAKARREGDK